MNQHRSQVTGERMYTRRILNFEMQRLPMHFAQLFPALRELHWQKVGEVTSSLPASLLVFVADAADIPWHMLVACPLLERVQGSGSIPDPKDFQQWPRLQTISLVSMTPGQSVRLRTFMEAFPEMTVNLEVNYPWFNFESDTNPLQGLRVRHFKTACWRNGEKLPWHLVRAKLMTLTVHEMFDFGLLTDADLRANGLQRLELRLTITSDLVVDCPRAPFHVTVQRLGSYVTIKVLWSADCQRMTIG